MSSWKLAKEAAVANHDGSSVLDVLTISAVAPLCFGLRLELARRGWSGALLDVAVVVAPLAFVLTTGCDAALAVACGAGACLAVAARGAPPPRAAGDPAADVRLFRCGQALATSVCILAVDFPAFPRRFCKTEAFGVSLMDAGAGSFAFGNGLASRCAEFKSSTRIQCERMRKFRRNLFGFASRTRREQSIRPKISRIDFDLTELENS